MDPTAYTTNVIPLGTRTVNDAYPGLKCGCGSAWFNAEVCLEGRQVSGYMLPITCRECGTEVTP